MEFGFLYWSLFSKLSHIIDTLLFFYCTLINLLIGFPSCSHIHVCACTQTIPICTELFLFLTNMIRLPWMLQQSFESSTNGYHSPRTTNSFKSFTLTHAHIQTDTCTSIYIHVLFLHFPCLCWNFYLSKFFMIKWHKFFDNFFY